MDSRSPIKILGIDPGLRVTGFGVIRVNGQHLEYLASGVIRTGKTALSQRLALLFQGIQAVIAEHQPNAASVEKVFVNTNPHSTLLLGQARGAALCSLAHSGLNVFEYTALQIKKAICGYGHAAKSQLQANIQTLLHLGQAPGMDAADALGAAICHAYHHSNAGPLPRTNSRQRQRSWRQLSSL